MATITEATKITTTTTECTGIPNSTSFAHNSLKRARILFDNNTISPHEVLLPSSDKSIHKSLITRLVKSRYPIIPADGIEYPKDENTLTAKVINELRDDVIMSLKSESTTTLPPKKASNALMTIPVSGAQTTSSSTPNSLVLHREEDVMEMDNASSSSKPSSAIALPGQKVKDSENNNENRILLKKSVIDVPKPKWHAPWKLSSVLSSHLGWVRSVTFDHTNDMFATGGADRVIKIFDLAKASVGAEDALKITLTGHISPVRGLAFSPRYPYLFSAGEDKMVKCWDLETNQVVRHYHGHLSGVYCLKLHPTLDILVTAGRDAVARVWDIRTKHMVHCLSGHDNTVGAILTKTTDPQIITGSYDSTIKLWDLAAGKCMTTLTHHKKSIRALAQPTYENTFISGAADTLKKWHGRTGQFLKNFSGHNAVINALAINEDGVVVSAADNGTINFWDYNTGYTFQKTQTVVQPGSLDAENTIYATEFDLTGTRLITCEGDKTVKIWKQDDEASELTHPIDMTAWKKKCVAEAKQRY